MYPTRTGQSHRVMGRWLARTATVASLAFLWMLPLCSPAVAGTTQPPTNDNGFQFEWDPGFPHGATQVMHYMAVGVIIIFAVTLIGLVVYRGRPDNGSGFSRSGS
jgi:ABC-type Fe3+ transport system permease subunit